MVSGVRCQVSGVTCEVSCVFFVVVLIMNLDKMVELVGGGSVINGATSLVCQYKQFLFFNTPNEVFRTFSLSLYPCTIKINNV